MIDKDSSSIYGDHQSGVGMACDDMLAAAEPLG